MFYTLATEFHFWCKRTAQTIAAKLGRGERSWSHIEEALILWKNFAFSRLAATISTFRAWSQNVTVIHCSGGGWQLSVLSYKRPFCSKPKTKVLLSVTTSWRFWLMFWSKCLTLRSLKQQGADQCEFQYQSIKIKTCWCITLFLVNRRQHLINKAR